MSEFIPGLPGFAFADLFRLDGLTKLDQEFLARLQREHKDRHTQLLAYRAGQVLPPMETSELLLACAPLIEDVIGDLFNIDSTLEQARARTLAHNPVFAFKKLFVLRRARRRLLTKEDLQDFPELDGWLTKELNTAGLKTDDLELAVAQFGQRLLDDADAHKDAIEMLTRWCIQAIKTDAGKARVAGWVSFRLPVGVDYANLVPVKIVKKDDIGRYANASGCTHLRDGFNLTDLRMNPRQVLNEVNYCIYCHDHDGDFCSKGFPEKKGEPDKGIKKNAIGVSLDGCPLEEKISEMHSLKRDGHTIAALAMIMLDNPMCPATGHRICNDCMKSCIYQKQEPVNIPQIETACLTDVLQLPWGVEIYDLLTRWNPLRAKQWLPKPYNGLKVMVTGMGPAGFTLAHHLLMEGFAVVGVDGLKIESLPESLVQGPICNYQELEEDLGTRVMAGFGGVAEYGITVRWDKNFLTLIYLTLARRPHFQVFGCVRFGGTVTLDDAWELGFDHVAIAVGAGLPQALPIPGSLARGMRQAADFLMALQLTGAAQAASLANLQVRLPAVVIGGGLTGIDTATEVQAYYIAQVEKTLSRYETLVAAHGDAHVRQGLDEESKRVLDEFLAHGKQVRTERARAKQENRRADFIPLLQQWGGVTVAYRRPMSESPAYQRNHEEVIKAMEEGIYYADNLSPTAAGLDDTLHVNTLVCRRMHTDADGKLVESTQEVKLPARSIFVATGAKPNIAYYFEHRGSFELDAGHYQAHEARHGKLVPVAAIKYCKAPDFGAFTSYEKDGHRVSFIGDTHPAFNGSVVKAVASGYRTYPKIVAAFGARAADLGGAGEYAAFRSRMQHLFQPRLEAITRCAANAVELVIHAPMAAKGFRPGEIYRLQNYQRLAPMLGGTRLQTETMAITGSKVDKAKGTVTLIVLERGASSRIAATFKPGDAMALMGPSGTYAHVPEHQTLLIVADRLGATGVRALAPALSAAGNKILFFASFRTPQEVFHREEFEAACDRIVWVCAAGSITPQRPQDRSYTGDVRDALKAYAAGRLGDTDPLPLDDMDRLYFLGSGCLVQRLRDLRHNELSASFTSNPPATGSVYGSMQCMLKGVCSQCLQWQMDPVTGKRTKAVFTCSWQDQPLDMPDYDSLQERLAQNRLAEHLSNLWLEHLFATHEIERV
jgi:NADPH-dependent glutamate synthase beta subunit-like oxidoreductase/NAD(P)H-flavin reductase